MLDPDVDASTPGRVRLEKTVKQPISPFRGIETDICMSDSRMKDES